MLWTKNKNPTKSQIIPLRSIVINAGVGVFLLLIAICLLATDPIYQIVRISTQVSNGSFLYNVFQTEVEGAKVSLTVFNITNAEQFLSGEDYKLKLEEVGPFTYMEIRRNGDIELLEDEGALWFTPHMKVRFVPEESVGYPQNVTVTVPSLALMSATSLLQKYPSWIRKAFNLLIMPMNPKSITNLDAHSFLWGYKDPLIALANKLAPGLIYFDRLGIIDRLYDNKTFYRMKVGITDDYKFGIKVLNKYLKRMKLEDQYPLESYTFNNTYEGVSYSPGVTRDTPIEIYRTGVCRTLNLEFYNETDMDYVTKAWNYRISNETFNRDCDIPNGICGMLDLSGCTYGIPIAISRTHFLHTDPKIFERIEGMKPDEVAHESLFTLEPKLGYELVTNLTLQLNMVLGDLSFNEQMTRFSNMTVPIAYIRVIQPEVMDEFKLMLKIVHIYGPKVLLSISVILVLISLFLIVKAVRLYIKKRNIEHEQNIVLLNMLDKELPLLS